MGIKGNKMLKMLEWMKKYNKIKYHHKIKFKIRQKNQNNNKKYKKIKIKQVNFNLMSNNPLQ